MNHAGAPTLVDDRGRKYLTADERTRFLAAARTHPKPTVQTFARTLALTLTGCRVSEALAIRACDVDLAAAELRILTLKRRREVWRAVPVLEDLIHELDLMHRVRRLSLHRMLETLKPYLLGWRGYFGFCQTPRVLTSLEAWIRRRLRASLWRQWNNGHKRFKELRRRGLSTFQAAIAAGSPTACWRMARHVAVQQALRNHHFDSLGPPDSTPLLRPNPGEPPWYGPVCPVVWEGRHREVPPIPINPGSDSFPDRPRPRRGPDRRFEGAGEHR